jgi:hypothetical protein
VWVLAAVYIGIDVLRYLGDRAYEHLTLELLVVIVGLVGARQYGMLDQFHFIPRLGGHEKKPKAVPARGRGQKVVAGPWEGTTTHSPLEEAELDGLLDKISAQGMDALSKTEKARLNELSKKLRGR